MITTQVDRLGWLRGAIQDGSIHTVRASFADRLGHWRGKRVPADYFLTHADQELGFCDGMLVCDVRCDIIEETPYSNYGTGYPDFHVRFDLARLRPVGWITGEAYVFGDPYDHDGRPSPVSPRHVLRRVLDRLSTVGIRARVGLRLGGRFMRDPYHAALIPAGGLGPGDDEVGALSRIGAGLRASEIPVVVVATGPEAGAFRLTLANDEPMASAEAGVVAKAAAKEIARQSGVTASFMTLQRGAVAPSLLEPTVDLELTGSVQPTAMAIQRRLAEVRALLQPSVNAFKAGPPSAPIIRPFGRSLALSGVSASSEADPFTVIAAELAAFAVSIDSANEPAGSLADGQGLGAAAEQLARTTWVAEWLGPEFIANALPLLAREDRLLQSSVTDWEIDRYWGTA